MIENEKTLTELIDDMVSEEMPLGFSETNEYIAENIIKLKELPDDISLDLVKFKSGIDDVSFLCGQVVALTNVGITPSKAMEYLVEKEATGDMLEYNLKIAEITSTATVEASKRESVHSKTNSI